jgi:serine/threonine protein kinase
MNAPAPDPLIGRVLDGKYQIIERIGSGGMGTVYRAIHVSLGAPRALKVMRRELAGDASLAARFRTEARLAEGLRHPHLVALYDFGQLPQEGGWYIVSEFVDGATLAVLLRRRGVRFASSDVGRLMHQLADGLALAHRKGVVHRDISPDNVMLSAIDGEVVAKLLDFGIAKDTVRPSRESLTGMGWNVGKIGFSSPEQMGSLREGEAIDARSDVFSLAAVAYLMITGRLPWRRDSVQAYTQDLLLRPHEELEAEVRAHVPPAWRDVFAAALSRSRDGRIADMPTLKARFAEAAAGPVSENEPPQFRVDMLRASSRDLDEVLGTGTPVTVAMPATPEPPPAPVSTAAPAERPLVPSTAFSEDLARFEQARYGALEPMEALPRSAPVDVDVRRHVVVLDDDEALRQILPALIDGPDVRASAGPWRGDAAAFAAAHAPDLILLDVDADDCAAERLERLRGEPKLQKVPMVLFSSADEWTLRALAGRTGANGYLPKAALGCDIAGAVRRLLRQTVSH